MLYKDFIISACYAYLLSIIITASACHACLLSIISMIRSIDYAISSILVKTCA